MAGTRLSIRIDLENGDRIGPGKVALLEAIRATGSISAAARALGMSYRRAWLLVEEVNNALREPAVAAATGGRSGGGAVVTPRRAAGRPLSQHRVARAERGERRVQGDRPAGAPGRRTLQGLMGVANRQGECHAAGASGRQPTESPMKLSARNILKGTVVEVKKGRPPRTSGSISAAATSSPPRSPTGRSTI